MAVTITTKFYEEDTPAWHDLSKVVFTSPNMPSPNTAGTRSHIFPGGAIPLGLWYEDVSNMYRIEPEQLPTVSGGYAYDTPTVTGTESKFHMGNTVAFEVTVGECYDCKLTAWDDSTHTTTVNELLFGNYCKVSSVVYYYNGTDFKNPDSITEVHAPRYNGTMKGDVFKYDGAFDMRYRDPGIYGANAKGDFLIFKPMLLGLTGGISYGVHNFVITLHYSYT